MSAEARVAPMPPFWIAWTLLGWGLFTGNLTGAVVMAALLEGIARAPVKWRMAEREFHRAADLTSVVFAVVTVAQFSRYSVHGVYQILKVVPFCFFPLLLAQRASTAQTIPMSALFYSLRRQQDYRERLDVAPAYIALCLLAASTGAPRDPRFAAFAVAVVLGLLVAARPRRHGWPRVALALCLAAALAAATQFGMLRAQRWLEASFLYWVNQFPWAADNLNREVTAIGAIGRLKLSDRIRLRVLPSPDLELPLLLQEASFDTFNFGTWAAHQAPFAALDQRVGAAAWDVAPPGRAARRLTLSLQHRRELALLPAPRGTRVVASGAIAELQKNRFGTLMAEAPPGELRYTVESAYPLATEPPPVAGDVEVPTQYQALLRQALAETGAADLPPADRAARIQRWFLDNFSYSLVQGPGVGWRTPLADFLTRTRRGHCEYFATASTLMLRAAGIPARYAVGYAVDEYSALEDAYVVRARHAHAWTLAWINGAWVTIDATPAGWFDLENARGSGWQTLQDVGSWLVYRYQRLTALDLDAVTDKLIWLVPPLAALLYWRLRRSPTAVRAPAVSARTGEPPPSPMLPLLSALAARGLAPRDGETMAAFLIRAAPPESGGVARADLLAPYYRLRYGGAAVDEADFSARLARYCAGLAG